MRFDEMTREEHQALSRRGGQAWAARCREEARLERVVLRLPPYQREWLERTAEAEGISIAAVVRQAVDAALVRALRPKGKRAA